MKTADFLALPAKQAVSVAYKALKAGKIDYETFDKTLRAWWRHNHVKGQAPLENLVSEVFDT